MEATKQIIQPKDGLALAGTLFIFTGTIQKKLGLGAPTFVWGSVKNQD